jgi:hypothetical protein
MSAPWCHSPDPVSALFLSHERDGVNPTGVGRTRHYGDVMVSFIKSVTFDCREPLLVAAFWAEALGSNVDEDSTVERAWVEPAGWGGPSLWFVRVPEEKVAKNRQHFDLRPTADPSAEVERLVALGARVLGEDDGLVVMADPEGNEFCVE